MHGRPQARATAAWIAWARRLPGVHLDFPDRPRAVAILGAQIACSRADRPDPAVQPSRARNPSTAARKSPLYCSIIDSSRLPRCDLAAALFERGSRASSTRRASPSARASAQRGAASARVSRRRRAELVDAAELPELPPLSNIVTTA